MSVFVGRDARLFTDGTEIAYAKNISFKATASSIEEHTMDSNEPALSKPGNLTYEWSCERLYVNEDYTTLILDGTHVTIIFDHTGAGTAGKQLADAFVTSFDNSAGMDGGVIQRVTGKGKTLTTL